MENCNNYWIISISGFIERNRIAEVTLDLKDIKMLKDVNQITASSLHGEILRINRGVLAPFLNAGIGLFLISGKIAEILKKFNIENIDLIPIHIEDELGRIIDDYFAIKFLSHEYVTDKCNSQLVWRNDSIRNIFYWKLDALVTKKLGLDLFKSVSFTKNLICSDSLKKELEKVGPLGIEFININDFRYRDLEHYKKDIYKCEKI